MNTSLILRSALVTGGAVAATYSARHSTPGREGTSLDSDIKLVRSPAGVTASVEMTTPILAAEEVALDKLAEWLERTALALRGRKLASYALPLYGADRCTNPRPS